MPDDGLSGYPLLGLSQRRPPQNLEAEQALLGALLSNNKALDRCGLLRREHFADAIHGVIYAAIVRRVGAGRVADAVSLKTEFENAGTLDEVGGTVFLARLLGAAVAVSPATEYARAIMDCWQRRQTIDIGTEMVNAAFGGDPSRDGGQIAREAAILLDELGARQSAALTTTLDAAMDQALAAMERARRGETAGISSGFRRIDARLGGLEPGLVYVIAGRPGMGKSSIGHQIAVNVARAGHGVLALSLEMSATQLGRRTLSTMARVPIRAMKDGSAGTDMVYSGAIVQARKELAGLPLTIDDAGGQTPAMIASRARAARRKHGLGLVMIDHLNLMRADEADAKHGGTWATERASGAVLQMAKDCECPVLLLAQLNRGVEGREDKRPTLSDLRQAGAIEQDAYAVGFVYRPEYYLSGRPEGKVGEAAEKLAARIGAWESERESLKGRAELIWSKVRDGEPGTDSLAFHGPTASFSEE